MFRLFNIRSNYRLFKNRKVLLAPTKTFKPEKNI